MLDEIRIKLDIPAQACVLAHVTTTLYLIGKGAPVDLCFQSIAGTEAANKGFGIDLALLKEARAAALSLRRGTVGDNVMYFETGQGSALSANAHHGVDQQTLEARAYAVARSLKPLLVNSVVGFIGPEYLYDGFNPVSATASKLGRTSNHGNSSARADRCYKCRVGTEQATVLPRPVGTGPGR